MQDESNSEATESRRTPDAIAAVVTCPISGNHATCVATKRGYRIYGDGAVTHFFVYPPPSDEQLRAYYSSKNAYGARWAHTDLQSTSNQLAISLDRMLREKFHIADGRFLDIGCGDGRLLFHMRKLGWSVTGVDYSEEYVAKCRAYGLDVQVGALGPETYPPESVDVVYLGDAIEHLVEPTDIVAEAERILRPGGAIVIRTPNALRGFSRFTLMLARFGGLQWFASEAPAHLHDFSMMSLTFLVERLGFEVVEKGFYGRDSVAYSVGASGYFDELKRVLKQGSPAAKATAFLLALPRLVGVSLLVVPCVIAGRAYDWRISGGASLFLVARKRGLMGKGDRTPADGKGADDSPVNKRAH